MTLDEIKQAITEGKKVKHQSDAYDVIKDGDRYLIECNLNGWCMGLTHVDGITVNGKPEDFYISEI